MIDRLKYAWSVSFGQHNWRETGQQVAAISALIVVVYLFVAYGNRIVRVFDDFATCPIHITTSDTYGNPVSDYCLHIGIGR